MSALPVKPVVLFCFLTGVCGILLTVANMKVDDPNNPNRVPHPEGAMLAVKFAHADHTEQNCVICHHNFVDTTGSGMCFDCHNTDPQVAPEIEDQFHDLCRGCHEELTVAGERHGPTRQCVDCHVPDTAP